jgi:hypothetical protein
MQIAGGKCNRFDQSGGKLQGEDTLQHKNDAAQDATGNNTNALYFVMLFRILVSTQTEYLVC